MITFEHTRPEGRLMNKYTLHPCRNTDNNGNIERCDAWEADFFTIYQCNEDGTEDAVIDFNTKGEAEEYLRKNKNSLLVKV